MAENKKRMQELNVNKLSQNLISEPSPGLPVPFCKKRLSFGNEVMILEDENGEESETKYLARKTGLSDGCIGFAIKHELVDGDALVFQLVSPTKFKVYIARAYDSEDTETNENMEDNEGKENIKDNDLNAIHLGRRSKRNRASTK